MNRKIIGIIILLTIILFPAYIYFSKKTQISEPSEIDQIIEKNLPSTNIIENVEYTSKDSRGNEYIIRAKFGEMDINKNNIIYLTNVSATIKLKNSKKILISADFGKYNINNFDTNFSKNVLVDYINKKIYSEYLDFSILRNSMIISKNVVYNDIENTLKTDVVEIDLKSKDIKFYMYDKSNKVNIVNNN